MTDLSIQTLTSLVTTDLLNIGMDRLITVTISTIEIGKAIVVTDIMVYFDFVSFGLTGFKIKFMYRQIPDTIKATWLHAGWAWTDHLEAPAVHVFTDLLEVVLGVVLLVVVLPRSLAGTTCADFVGWRAAASFSTLVNLEVSTTATMVHSCLNKNTDTLS